MNNADFYQHIQRIRRLHWLHYPVQTLIMAAVVLGLGSQLLGSAISERAAAWPGLLLLGAMVPVVGLLLYSVSRRLRPNLRRLAEDNLRIYKSRIFLRNSLLCLLILPLLVSYVLTHGTLEIGCCVILLLVLPSLTAPSAKAYQRWLLS
ncbi:hypothetical protein HMJ29_00545 [Hymenobacter taeanensis]|uniref:MFS transporter n=1 Tax=Hymenobacter taeanensis TaxID=2735321 RepID=A0A6M6BB53_9BACT|nr:MULTISPECIES: hypothetical protein [Hymenobacter]QJX45506.1 hypothetical protein HMJ29_00545 [Hymenobacter taeanensis]UOQ81247.1 hypothetical protein MUN83_00135 [Hymenobacter sp. 5414T-23]